MTGYISPTVWHSPTYHALRLFILPLSLLGLRVVDFKRYNNLNQRVYFLLLTASLMSLSILAKPSYAIALIPGLLLFALCLVVMNRPVDWKLLLLGIVLPGIVMITLQYLLSFGDDAGVQFGFFALWRLWIPDWQIPVRLLLSLAFPLSVYILYFGEARKNIYLNTSWLIFLVGFIFMFFFNETGQRFYHSNFNWTGYCTMFALMFATVHFLVEHFAAERRSRLKAGYYLSRQVSMRFLVVASVFALHVVFGMMYWCRYQSFPV